MHCSGEGGQKRAAPDAAEDDEDARGRPAAAPDAAEGQQVAQDRSGSTPDIVAEFAATPQLAAAGLNAQGPMYTEAH